MREVGILGIGSFGFAILRHLDSQNNCNLHCYDKNEFLLKILKNTRTHPNGEKISNKIIIEKSMQHLINSCEIIFIATGSEHTREIIPYLTKDKIIINTCKALDHKTGKPLSEIYKEHKITKYAAIAGANFAEDFGKPMGVDVASKDNTNELAKALLENKLLRVYKVSDLIGLEYASAFKNILSMFAGILDGQNYPQSTKTFLITRAAKEAKEYSVKKGARLETFAFERQCWGSDVWMSSTTNTRNYRFGKALGQMDDINKTKESFNHILVEGLHTIESLNYLEKYPLLSAIRKMLKDNLSPKIVLRWLEHSYY